MIRVLVDDLAFVAADAVLRPADHLLAPVTPAMTRLDRQAGPAFERLRQVRTPLERGAAVVTGGGELAAPFVLHVVVQDAQGMPDRIALRRALVSAWQQAKEWALADLAAPLVGAGAGQLAVEDAAALLAETFREHAVAGGCPATLAIVLEHEKERDLVEAAIRRAG